MNFSGKQESKPLVLFKLNGDTAPNAPFIKKRVNVTSWISVWLLMTQETKFISYCARDIARPRSPAIISSQNKKKKKRK